MAAPEETGTPVVYFICSNNTCRSPMAEAIARAFCEYSGINCVVKSAGTIAGSDPAAENAQQAMEEIGIDLSGHVSTNIINIDPSDNIIAIYSMADYHIKNLLNTKPALKAVASTLIPNQNINDPFLRDINFFRATRDVIKIHVEKRLHSLFQNDAAQ